MRPPHMPSVAASKHTHRLHAADVAHALGLFGWHKLNDGGSFDLGHRSVARLLVIRFMHALARLHCGLAHFDFSINNTT